MQKGLNNCEKTKYIRNSFASNKSLLLCSTIELWLASTITRFDNFLVGNLRNHLHHQTQLPSHCLLVGLSADQTMLSVATPIPLQISPDRASLLCLATHSFAALVSHQSAFCRFSSLPFTICIDCPCCSPLSCISFSFSNHSSVLLFLFSS